MNEKTEKKRDKKQRDMKELIRWRKIYFKRFGDLYTLMPPVCPATIEEEIEEVKMCLKEGRTFEERSGVDHVKDLEKGIYH